MYGKKEKEMTATNDWRMNLQNGDEFQLRGEGDILTVSSIEYVRSTKNGVDHIAKIMTNIGEVECFVYEIS